MQFNRIQLFLRGSMPILLVIALIFAVFVLILLSKTAVVVPQQSAYVVERLGKYHSTLGAGFCILLPFMDVIRYRQTLKERAMEIPEQICITRDNVQVKVDGILYFKIFDPKNASYGITNFEFAITQLAQTTLRSEIGKIELDRTFEERTHINISVVTELDKASEAWGVKVLRYEKRAVILQSEGVRDSVINAAEGDKQKVIKASEGNKQQQINQAEGQAAAILAVAQATAEGIQLVANSIKSPGGFEAVQLRVAEQYIPEFGKLAKAGNTLVLPLNISDVGSMVAAMTNVVRKMSPVASETGK